MQGKQKYFQVLGIEPTQDKQEIKRAYRKKAFLVHPDRNKSDDAAKQFVALTEAYEVLLDDGWSSGKGNAVVVEKTAAEEMAERMARAKARYYQAKEKEHLEEIRYYNTLVAGRRGAMFKWFGVVAALFSVVWCVDLVLLDEQMQDYFINGYAYTNHYAFIELDGRTHMFGANDMMRIIDDNRLRVFRTPLFNELKHVHVNDYDGGLVKLVPRVAFRYYFPFVNLAFLLPILTYVFKRPAPWFMFSYLLSKYVVSVLFLLVVFSKLGLLWFLFS